MKGALLSSLAAAALFLSGCGTAAEPSGPGRSAPGRSLLRIVVMDPLSYRLACECVPGYAQRDYDLLGKFLQERLGRPVQVFYSETLSSPKFRAGEDIDVVVGKFSEVVYDAESIGLRVRTVAMLTDKTGSVTQTGLFVVRSSDKAKSIEDLGEYRFLFGPEESAEKRAAAVVTLEAYGMPVPEDMKVSPSCNAAAMAVLEGDADVAVISSYAKPLLEGCGTIDRGALRVVAKTDPLPFITVFATSRLPRETERKLRKALLQVGREVALLAAVESRDGFVPLPSSRSGGPDWEWTDWRGSRRRDALSARVPKKLSSRPRLLWKRTCTGPGMSGLAVARGHVVVADKDLDEENDIFRCLDADTGRQLWVLAYPAAGEMDFTNSPRANPVIYKGLVYLLGAFGNLHCVKLETGEVVWKKSFVEDFDGERPAWGFSSTPLMVGDKLIVNPGAEDASLAALDRLTGDVLWRTPGEPAAYASFILGAFGGVKQVVGYDAVSLGGWDPETGKRLWKLVPEVEGDFNVPTPIDAGGRLLVSTENNGTRLYGFDGTGRIRPEPLATSAELAPDASTPVVCEGLVFGSYGGLLCLDSDDGLKTLWRARDDDLADYCSFIAGNGRVLIVTRTGKLFLLKAEGASYSCVARFDLLEGEPQVDRDVWSHPALVGNRLYVRSLLAVYCFLLE